MTTPLTTERRAARLFLAFAAALALVACRPSEGPTVVLRNRAGSEVPVHVEIADTAESRSVGLMYRKELPPDHGMVFLFEEGSDHSFWMKNTPLPLDMIFISKDGRVVGIQADTVPFSLDPRHVGVPSRVVLEVPAGFAAAHGLAAGDVVTYRGIASPKLP